MMTSNSFTYENRLTNIYNHFNNECLIDGMDLDSKESAKFYQSFSYKNHDNEENITDEKIQQRSYIDSGRENIHSSKKRSSKNTPRGKIININTNLAEDAKNYPKVVINDTPEDVISHKKTTQN